MILELTLLMTLLNSPIHDVPAPVIMINHPARVELRIERLNEKIRQDMYANYVIATSA